MIRLEKNKIIQYIWLYLMLLIPGSSAMSRYLNTTLVYGAVVGIYVFLMLLSAKYRNVYVLLFCILLVLATLIIRAKTGGVGPLTLLSNTAMLVVVYIAICIDKCMFLTRFVRIVCFFGVVSMLFWSVFCINPSLVNVWPATSYWTQNLGTGEWATVLHGKGLWLYSYLEIHATRNCGFYTEPGVYQIILNAALFVLLFWKDKLHFDSEKQYRTAIVIVLLTLVTCQSTTGYLSMMVILLVYFFKRDSVLGASKIKQRLVMLVAILAIVLFSDYMLRGESSLLYVQVLHKLFGGNIGGGIDLADSTGQYRLITVIASLKALSMDPFGIGFDEFYVIRDSLDPAAVAASIATYAAVYGVLFWLAMMIMIFYPMIQREPRKILVAVFAFMFINSTISETYLFYPGLMLFPIYLSVYASNEKSKLIAHTTQTRRLRNIIVPIRSSAIER
ncbi:MULTISPECIES: hypothetical protein [unclassified Bifidobacterium]|uniref:hypothetical protein n=1 Tax=unclassified Bifidobacterium TaxID=2608897 RepID=UPI00112B48C2|nr:MULTISPECIES: hypothetical protein [unclassified Bifidobacterium]TPF78521.1 hypothetical protein BW09_03355 [Bifidobacterium sp. UTCIF-1]TPF80801.1 hypothetical protein BW08_02310 [Bifidobacterium sp. UTCIF-24]TPF82759.1 hypothetical protein BW12_03310 [Bifidobacterium sp. UTCIF-3]TPF84468.1 hypothetical protein BW07_04245 [Bifidobacterium sp. UTCIF-36]TPF90972.1 hypothetical protein BW10_01785 [Bifidobacterium sp. UTBIF-56]